MILCKYENEWYLSTGLSADGDRCGIRCSIEMPHPHRFSTSGSIAYGIVPASDVEFFPTLSYKGFRIFQISWSDTREPILCCCISGGDIWAHYGNEVDCRGAIADLQSEGWTHDSKDRLIWGLVHVDALDKVRGAPPPGLH